MEETDDENLLADLRAKLKLPLHARLRSEGRLGEGGMAEVEVVFDETLRRRSACKRVHQDHLENEEILAEFLREVQITAALDHPFIVPVYQLGVNDTGQLFFTMKQISGTSLKELIAEFPPGRLNRSQLLETLEVLVKVCDALAFAHDRGVVHCDLKPEHIIVSDYGQVYLMDWGVAHILEDACEDLANLREQEGAEGEEVLKGTLAYMAPEQAEAAWDRVSPATDVFSLGAILYEVLARFPPYLAPDLMELLEAVRNGDFLPLEEEVEPGSVAPELEAIVNQAMALDPAGRFATAGELGEALRSFLGGAGEFPTVFFESGETIFREGDAADCAYLIKSGTCEAFRVVDDERISLEIMGEGTVFGELALLTDQIRSADVVALDEGVEAYRIRAVHFESELDHMRPWVRRIVEVLAERVRKHDQDGG